MTSAEVKDYNCPIEHEDNCVSFEPLKPEGRGESSSPIPLGTPSPGNALVMYEPSKTNTNDTNVSSSSSCLRCRLITKIILVVIVAVVITMIVSVVITVVVSNKASDNYNCGKL